MRCDQCKHWNINGQYNRGWDEETMLRPKVGLCTKAQPYWETTEWRRQDDDDNDVEPTVVRATKPEFDGLKMFVQDGSDYEANLLTTPDFFCAHFEPN